MMGIASEQERHVAHKYHSPDCVSSLSITARIIRPGDCPGAWIQNVRSSHLASRLWQAVDMKQPTLVVTNKLVGGAIAWKCSHCDQRFLIPDGDMPAQTKAALIDAEFSKHVREKHARVKDATKD
jgi:hypothetical protein